MSEPLLHVEHLTKHFPVTSGLFGRVVGRVRAVDDVSFEIAKGETLGLVGESGCGKTTVGRSLLRLIEPSGGRVTFDGTDVTAASPEDLTRLRRNLQIVFQDPYSSLNPRLRVVDIIGEALEVHGLAKASEIDARVSDLLRKVGLSPAWLNRYPHEFSGGQRQRIGIARAIALGPKLVVCDEAVSALDVSIQAQVLNLLIRLRGELGLSYLFIAHDLSVVRHVSNRIAVMYLGQIVELSPARRLFDAPAHPYTRGLLSAIPVPDPTRRQKRLLVRGDVPSPLNPPSGCRFHTRCLAVMDRCRTEDPATYTVEEGHAVKCFHAEGLEADSDWFARLDERIRRATADNEATAGPAPAQALPPVEPRPRVRRRTPEAVRSGPERRRRTAAIGVAALVFLAIVVAFTRFERLRDARTALAALSAEIAAYRAVTGTYPERLSDLGWRLYPIFERGEPRDPWGRALYYRAPGTDGRPFDLGSTGPDGAASGDDIGSVPKAR